jgi:hypothetical protein
MYVLIVGNRSFLLTTLATPIAETLKADARKRAGCKGRRHNRCVIDAIVSEAKGGGANAYGA